MALISCPECGKQMSNTAAACPHCGASVSAPSAADERKCGECGAVLPNGAAVCPVCGCPAEIGSAQPVRQSAAQPQQSIAQSQQSVAQPQQYSAQSQYGNMQPQQGGSFVEPDEQVIATIGNSNMQNFFTSGIYGSNGAILTNKRFYYNGKATRATFSAKMKCVIELSEITAVDIIHSDHMFISIFMAVIWQIIAIIFFANNGKSEGLWIGGLIFELITAIAVFIGIMSRKNMLCIMHRGGSFSFPIKLYGFAQCSDFLRKVLLARRVLLDHQNGNVFFELK